MIDLNALLIFLKSLIPYLPALVVLCLIIKLFSSGLSMITKVISSLFMIGLCYWAVTYLLGMFA